MSAYAALNSLLRTAIANGVQPLYEKVILLLDFLENYSGSQIPGLERKMREAAYKAEDAIFVDSLSRSFRDLSETAFCILCDPEVIPLWVCSFIFGIYIPVALPIFPACVVGLHIALRLYHSFRAVQLLPGILHDFGIIVEEVKGINKARGDDEMSCYAALIYLRQILDSTLDSGELSMTHNITQLKSLHEKVIFLLSFLRNASTYMESHKSELLILDAKIRDAAYKAKVLVQFQIPAKVILHHQRSSFQTLMKILLVSCFVVMYAFAIWKIPPPRPLNFQLIFESYPVWIQKFSLFVVYVALIHGAITMCKSFTVAVDEISENEDLRLVIDDLNIIERKVIEIKDARENSSDLLAAAAAAASSRWDLRGSCKNVVVGLESDLEQLRARLTQDSSKCEISSIVGMGGIGKTTLARLVYNDPHIAYHFDVRAWVTVSQEYSLHHALLCLLKSANVFTNEMQEADDDNKLGVYLHKSLMSRRYLIVMDDVWDTQIWDSISIFLPENCNGSRVLMTSRLSNVASYIDSSSPIHQMQCLNEDDSWYLLREKVFGRESCPVELESIGREIAQNCRGLPLAILVIGGLLYKDNQNNIWREVAENTNTKLRQNEEECLEVLGLSYKYLPQHLRPCFLYMGVFPGETEISVSKLIRLWVAEGFLRPCTSKSLEEVAEDCLQDLIARNLIFVCKSSCNGKIRTCSIHDLLRAVSLQKARDENFLDVVRCGGYLTQESHGRTVRRLSIDPDALQVNAGQDLISSCNYHRSFLCIASKPIKDSSVVYLGFLYLRVLDVLEVHFCEFPDQIVKLVHLRYLAFHCDGPLSPSMSKLQELETLVYHHCSFHKYPVLPWVIWSMQNLRHLYVNPGCHLSAPLCYRVPWNSFILEHLQTLMGIRNFKWSKDIIRRISKLKKLGISYYVSCSVDWSIYLLECLVDLNQLETLKITITYDNLGSDISCDPPKLAYPHKLKKLTLSGCGIPWESMRMMGALSNLEALKLRCEACSGPSWETVEGEFPQLKFLLLEKMRFELWDTDEKHFPRLQRIFIRSCGMLEEIPSAIGDIPTLEMIELVDCLPSAVDYAQRIQEDQEDMGNDDLKVRIGLTSHIL